MIFAQINSLPGTPIPDKNFSSAAKLATMNSFTVRKDDHCDDHVMTMSKPGVTHAFNRVSDATILAGQKRTGKNLVN